MSVRDTEVCAVTGGGVVARLTGVPDGEQTVEIFSAGYEAKELRVTFPVAQQGGTVVFLTDRFRTRPYGVLGLFGEKTFGRYSPFVNAENFTDTRQSRFTTVVFPPHERPAFAEIYAHTEGRVFNGGVKIKL